MPIKVEFVSDVTCPWCAIGLAGVERAIGNLRPRIQVDLTIEPFELNPDLPPEGEDIAQYAARTYGAGRDELAQRQALVRARGEAVGLRFALRTRVWNTFDAHRLLLWASTKGRALEVKRALLAACHTRGENPGAHDVLLAVAADVGLDVERTRAILAGGEYAAEVRARVRGWQTRGLTSVPSVVIAERHLIQGAQTAAVYEQALRRIAGAAPAAPTAA